MTKPNIALCGKSGVGKTTVGLIIVERFGYQLCSTGQLCRKISELLFGEDRRCDLNQISEALRNIDKEIWIKAALRGAVGDAPIILDSIRYHDDYLHVRQLGWKVVRIVAPTEETVKQLISRGQKFDHEMDFVHASETSLEKVPYDALIQNNYKRDGLLLEEIDKAVARLTTA